MKLDIKKLYKSTIKTLERHQMEVTLAIAALSIVTLAPQDEEEVEARNQLVHIYNKVLREIDSQLEVLNELIEE
jgi:hypothetical protein